MASPDRTDRDGFEHFPSHRPMPHPGTKSVPDERADVPAPLTELALYGDDAQYVLYDAVELTVAALAAQLREAERQLAELREKVPKWAALDTASGFHERGLLAVGEGLIELRERAESAERRLTTVPEFWECPDCGSRFYGQRPEPGQTCEVCEVPATFGADVALLDWLEGLQGHVRIERQQSGTRLWRLKALDTFNGPRAPNGELTAMNEFATSQGATIRETIAAARSGARPTPAQDNSTGTTP